MRSRSRLEIYLGLMEEVSRHSDPVSMGKKVNSSLDDTEKHLGFLVSQGFLRVVETDELAAKYQLTLKGSEVLEALRGIAKPEPSPLLEQ